MLPLRICSMKTPTKSSRPRATLAGCAAAALLPIPPRCMYVWMHHHFPHIVDCRPIDIETWLSTAGFTITRVERLVIWGLPVAACRAVVAA